MADQEKQTPAEYKAAQARARKERRALELAAALDAEAEDKDGIDRYPFVQSVVPAMSCLPVRTRAARSVFELAAEVRE